MFVSITLILMRSPGKGFFRPNLVSLAPELVLRRAVRQQSPLYRGSHGIFYGMFSQPELSTLMSSGREGVADAALSGDVSLSRALKGSTGVHH